MICVYLNSENACTPSWGPIMWIFILPPATGMAYMHIAIPKALSWAHHES